VPRVDREEFVNAGMIVSCPTLDVLEARIELNEARLLALDSAVDLEAVRTHLASIPIIARVVRMLGRSAGSHAGNDFTGWWLLAAPSFKRHVSTLVIARARAMCSSIC